MGAVAMARLDPLLEKFVAYTAGRH